METLGEEWRTGKLGRLQSMGSQRVGHDLATEQEQSMGTETMGRILCETVVSDGQPSHRADNWCNSTHVSTSV